MRWTQPYIASLVDEYNNEELLETKLLIACGRDPFECLQSLATALSDGKCSEEMLRSLEQLARTAYDRLAMSKGASVLCWRQFTVNAYILHSLACSDKSQSLKAIGILDQAIIITGGTSRLDMIHSLIGKLQPEVSSSFSPSADLSSPILPASSVPLVSASQPVTVLPLPPSLPAFRDQLAYKPFVVRGYVKDWPALNEHPWHSMEYLRRVSGPGRVVPVEVGYDYRTADWQQKLIEWDTFLLSLHSTQGEGPLYLAQHNLFLQFPLLERDIVIPDYVYTAPSPPDNYATYKPPGNDEQLVINTWFGPKGTSSPAHTDPYFNLYVQVVGKKTIWLAPPECNDSMHSYASPCQPIKLDSEPTEDDGSLMGNTSRIDVFRDDIAALYPAFSQQVIPRAIWVTLEPGDILSFPPGWWHAMRADEISFSVSMWF